VRRLVIGLIGGLIGLGLLFCRFTAVCAQSLSNGDGDLRVMTYNANEGSDFIEVEQATTTTQFLIAVGKTISQVRETKPPERMQALAAQIASAAPMLVSLQEVDQWYSGPFNPTTGTCGAATLEFDSICCRSYLAPFRHMEHITRSQSRRRRLRSHRRLA
jgi:hypothetical protein